VRRAATTISRKVLLHGNLVIMWADVQTLLRIFTSHVHPDYEHHFYQNLTSLSSSPTRETSNENLTLICSSFLLVGGVGHCAQTPLMDPLSNLRIRRTNTDHQCNVTDNKVLRENPVPVPFGPLKISKSWDRGQATAVAVNLPPRPLQPLPRQPEILLNNLYSLQGRHYTHKERAGRPRMFLTSGQVALCYEGIGNQKGLLDT